MKKILPLFITIILLGGCIQISHDASIPESTEAEPSHKSSISQSAENETQSEKETENSLGNSLADNSICSNSSQVIQPQNELENPADNILWYFKKHWESLPWGNISDEMKTYEDHLGKNNYKDYTMLTWMVLPDSTSMKITLSMEIVGSQFLTSLQKKKPLPPPQEPPSDSSFATILSITDDEITTTYTFFENGDIYTEQKGNRYYLGNSTFKVHYHTMIFLSSASTMYADDIVLPNFNIDQEHSNTMNKKREFLSSGYDVYYVPNDYGDLGSPLLIGKTDNKEYILKTLSNSWTPTSITQRVGSGLIIRLHNQQEILNFMVYDDYIINYQYPDNNIAFKLPNDFYRRLQFIAATELAYKL
ncbi:MAG: hypothetical protein RR710_09280, partial [Oscillospiraceae bacterium]